ncbi:MAG: L,D-transpeptidase family protein [Aquificae bacterium]|nr:L,D-transpeptidase family protein [Aquificota bacterium]
MLLFFLLLWEGVFGSVELEKGRIELVLKKLADGSATEEELKAVKAYFQELPVKVEKYLVLYAKGLLAEREGKLEEALRFYLSSIELNPFYNPSYYRFNFLIRRVEKPELYRKRLVKILKQRFLKTPPVLVENPPDRYVFIVEKMSQYLFIFKGKKLVEMHPVTTGKNLGDKEREGDARTPEGLYYFTRIIPPDELADVYGGIAVAINYPNPYDRLVGKTGGGIWLHGSNEEDRNKLPFSTRGCVVADNEALKKSILPKISLLNTLIGIYKVVPTELKLDDVKGFLKAWEKAWEEKDLERYLSFYSESFRWKGGGKDEWRRYKRRTILSKKFIKVEIKDLTVLAFAKKGQKEPLYYLVEFFQEYESDSYADKGIKRMYIVKEGRKLKILSEEFQEVGER